MDLTVVIPFYNGDSQTADKLLKTLQGLKIPTIVVDDVSEHPLSEFHGATLLNLNKKRYFSGAVNEGIKACETDVLVLNQDVSLYPGTHWLDTIEKYRHDYAMIGEMIQGGHPAWKHSYIKGTFMFMRRDAIEKIGLLDEVHFPHWGSTSDWQCRAARKGFRIKPLQTIPGFTHLKKRGVQFGESTKTYLRSHWNLVNRLILTPPIISVIIPSFNHGQYLQSAVNSLIGGETDLGYMPGQSFQGFEIIIVDDASTDGESREIAASLADDWKGIKFVQRSTNGGTGAANNSGIAISSSRYVTVMCADDMMEHKRLARMLWEIRKDENRVIYDNLQLFRNGERIDYVIPGGGKSFPCMKMKEYDFNKLLYKNQMHCGILFRKKAWAEIGGYPEVMKYGREDWAINIALGINGYCGKHINEALYLYRRERQNRTIKNTTPTWHRFFLGQMKKLFPRIYARERPMGCCGNRAAPTTELMKTLPREIQEMQGVEGMILLEYFGKSMGSQSWYGPITGKQYSFGLTRDKIQPVDPKDLQTNNPGKPGFLEIREQGVRIFRVAKNQGKAKAQPSASGKVPAIPVIEAGPSVAEDRAFQPHSKVVDISAAAKELADEMGVRQADVEDYITGTGINGKITVKDIREYAAA